MKFILALLLVSSSAFADEWSREDTYREAAYLTLHTLDWAQTRNIARNPDYQEQNRFLGNKPSTARINQYFIATAIINYYVSYILPSEYRKAFQYVTIGIETEAVVHNFSLGIKANF